MDTPDKTQTPSCCTPKIYERGKIDVIENIYVKAISVTLSIKRSSSIF